VRCEEISHKPAPCIDARPCLYIPRYLRQSSDFLKIDF
jgi:hypothetical protein